MVDLRDLAHDACRVRKRLLKTLTCGSARNEKTRTGIADAGFLVVEMRRLELLTPYMRRMFVANGVRSKTTSKGLKKAVVTGIFEFPDFPNSIEL